MNITMCENWKEIDGCKGYYVSSTGQVRNETGLVREQKSNNRVQVGLKVEGKWKRYDIGRLVAKAFLPNPYGLNTVIHKDGDCCNNDVSNLEWCSRSECPKIVRRRKQVEDSPNPVKEVCNPKKRAVFQISTSGEIIKRHSSIQGAARATNTSFNGIWLCLKGKTTTAGGFKWSYAD